MSTTTNNTSVQNRDEIDRQIKQAEMIRQYLQVTNTDRNPLPVKPVTSESYSTSTTSKNQRKMSELVKIIVSFFLIYSGITIIII
jgi:hypothetical protein